MRLILAIWLCNLSRSLLRLFGYGGTYMPGKLAMIVCPDLLLHLAKTVHTTVVTGTNGKTTSTRIIEQAFIENKLDYVTNRSGANLLSGITAEFAVQADIWGRLKATHAVIECDEGAMEQVCAYHTYAHLGGY